MVGERDICSLKSHSQHIVGYKYPIWNMEKIFFFIMQNKVKAPKALAGGRALGTDFGFRVAVIF